MNDDNAPYHAHIYYALEQRAVAAALRLHLLELKASAAIPQLLFVGELRDRKVGPHPVPQFEIHFTKEVLPVIVPLIEASGLAALVHPLTDDDLADHTTLALWIGKPLDLDLTTLDPPGMNQGVARFSKTDF
jgi:aromatic ring-cleaving dioxygenase